MYVCVCVCVCPCALPGRGAQAFGMELYEYVGELKAIGT